jgi:hypothetical protein
MSEAYARDGYDQARVGGIIIMAISVMSAILLIAALAYAAGTGGRHQAALAAAGCEPNLSHSGLPCTTVQALTRRYATITTPVLQQMNADQAAYTASEARRLPAAEAALTAEVTAEQTFGAGLARFPFPPAAAAAATTLIEASRAAVTLTAEQARASSLARLRSLNARVAAASAAVRTGIQLVAAALAAPPAAAQEP